MKKITTMLTGVLMSSMLHANPSETGKSTANASGTAEEEFIEECIEIEIGHESLAVYLDSPEVIVLDRQLNVVASGKKDYAHLIYLIHQSSFLTEVHETSYYRLEHVIPLYDNEIIVSLK